MESSWESCPITLRTSDEDNAAAAQILNLFYWRKRRSRPEPNMVINTSPYSSVIVLSPYMCVPVLFIPNPYLLGCRNNQYACWLNTPKRQRGLFNHSWSSLIPALDLVNTYTHRLQFYISTCKHIYLYVYINAALEANACEESADIQADSHTPD